jgi:spermidine synthase
VGQAVRALAPQAELVGVDRDRDVLRAARRHFGMDALGIEVIADDAFRYLRRERRRFDLIVEDLFVGGLRTVHKPEGLLQEGYPLIHARLAAGGFVTSNTIHETPAVARAMYGLGGAVLSLGVRGHWNHILVWARRVPGARAYRAALAAVPALTRPLRHIAVRRLRG